MLQKGRNGDVNCHGNQQVFFFFFFTVEHCLLTQTSHLFFLTTENRLTQTQETIVPSLSGVFLAFWTVF